MSICHYMSICFDSKSISHGSAKHFVYYKLNTKKTKETIIRRSAKSKK